MPNRHATGVAPSGPGSRASHEAPDGSSPKASIPNAAIASMNDYIDRAGSKAKTLMVSPPAYDELRAHSDPRDWLWYGGRPAIYRGALVNVHDEWSWGWMVRKADGSFVEPASAMSAGTAETEGLRAKPASAVAKPDAQGGPA